jgi:hypothetical protein
MNERISREKTRGAKGNQGKWEGRRRESKTL